MPFSQQVPPKLRVLGKDLRILIKEELRIGKVFDQSSL